MRRFVLNLQKIPTSVTQRTYHRTARNQLGIWDGLKAWVQNAYRNTTHYSAVRLFDSCKAQATNELWHTRGLVGKDFRSKHMILVVHVWIIHKRLLKEGKRGLLVQECLFDLLWDNTTIRIYEAGVGELSLNKYLKIVQGYSFRACVELDIALDTKLEDIIDYSEIDHPENSVVTDVTTPEIKFDNVEDKILDEISRSVFRSVYLKRDSISQVHALELARYIRREYLALQKLSREEIFEGNINWGSIPWNDKEDLLTDSTISEKEGNK